MGKTSTIQPRLTVVKSFYEFLEPRERDLINQIDSFILDQEIGLKRVVSKLPKFSMSPSDTSVEIVLNYSKQLSEMDSII